MPVLPWEHLFSSPSPQRLSRILLGLRPRTGSGLGFGGCKSRVRRLGLCVCVSAQRLKAQGPKVVLVGRDVWEGGGWFSRYARIGGQSGHSLLVSSLL